MSFKFRADRDIPAGTIVFVPENIKCENCEKLTPVQDYCIRCGEKLTLTYIGKWIAHNSDFDRKSAFQDIYKEVK